MGTKERGKTAKSTRGNGVFRYTDEDERLALKIASEGWNVI